MWLPKDICDLFASAFGLQFDTSTGFYLVNSTTHRQLRQLNPTVTFTVGSTTKSSSTTTVELPYSAFDLQAGIPLFNATTNYFPLRIAANESQQVLGRAFLQEAYLFVDWERDYFTIGQAIHQNSTTQIVPVLSELYISGSSTPAHSHSLSTGAIVGIAIGGCAVVTAIVALVVIMLLRSRRKRRAVQEANGRLPTELHSEHLKGAEIMSSQVYELQEGETSKHELCAKQLSELQADTPEKELDGDGERFGRYGWDKTPATYYELP